MEDVWSIVEYITSLKVRELTGLAVQGDGQNSHETLKRLRSEENSSSHVYLGGWIKKRRSI
jgi:hypothetical protein